MQNLIGYVVSSRREDLCLEMFILEGREVSTAQHWRGLWEKLFVGLSEGKMLFIFPGVLQKATWNIQ